ncbi:MAG TPA: FtsX-like permease family protein [Trebonia sp.]|nr:FtsX-like permease family protein [Trebonia sp.]
MRNWLTRLTAMGTAGAAALTLLACGAVFAATAGPREALASRTQALQQTIAATPPLARVISVTTTWTGVSSQLRSAGFGNGGGFGDSSSGGNLTAAQVGEITGQLRDEFSHGVIRLTPPGTDWAALTSDPLGVSSPLPPVGSTPVKLEITYRQPFYQHVRLVAGRFPASAGPQLLQVAVTSATARQFGLHVGSKVQITDAGDTGRLILDVTGIVAPRDPAALFWTANPTIAAPELQDAGSFSPPPTWLGQVIAGPGEIAAVQQDFGIQGLNMQWTLPLQTGAIGGQQAQPLYDALNQLTTQSVRLTGDVALVGDVLQASSTGLQQTTGAFIATADSVDTVLWLLYVSLMLAGLVALLLAARMVVLRRSAELAIRRARGASLWQLAAATAGGAALACVPAAVIAVGLAVLVVPGSRLGPGAPPAVTWWPPAAVLLVAVGAPAVIAVWLHRLPRRRAQRRRRPRPAIRLVAEATACLAAIAGILVFRQQGTQAGTGVNLYTSAAPALIAIPAVIVVLRVYPLVLRGLLRGSARRSGATAFLGLARAARSVLTPALPAFALVLVLSVTAFAGMVRDAVARGETAASWQAVGADATIMASTARTPGVQIYPAAVRAATGVPGVTHAAAVWQASWSTPNNDQITGLVVDPASYAALTAATQGFPQLPGSPRLLQSGRAGTPVPVLASPQAAAYLGHGASTLTSDGPVQPVQVRVAGVLPSTPALSGVPAFVIIPRSALHSFAVPPAPVPVNELLLTGASIDRARLAAEVRNMIPEGEVTFRSDILNSLTSAPLQHGTFVLFELAVVVAAGLGLAVMLLELALGGAEREVTLARLATMGFDERHRTRMVVLEVLPAVIAAAVAAWACAVVLPRVVAPAIDLSAFTGSPTGVALTPDVAAVALPLAGLAVVAAVALAIEIRTGRRRGVAASLRAGG